MSRRLSRPHMLLHAVCVADSDVFTSARLLSVR